MSARQRRAHEAGDCPGPTGDPPCAVCVEQGRQRKPGAGRPAVGPRRVGVSMDDAMARCVDLHAEELGGGAADAVRAALRDYYGLDA